MARGGRGEVAGAALAAASALLACGVAVVALHGTAWGFRALNSDSGFRTQAVTRFADSPALADYAYRGLPSYYPPAWPWLQGRAAALLDVPGWQVVKPAQVVLALAVPLVAYALWRRVRPPVEAGLVVAATTLGTAHLQKPDEWLVLAWLLPWWLEVVRGVRAPGVRPRPAWADGLLLGGLLLVHTYFFLPLAVATVAGWVLDGVRRDAPPLGVRRMAVIGGTGLAVSWPSWLPLVLPRLRGEPVDALQLRWSPRGVEVPPLPLDGAWWSLAAAAGVTWLVWWLRRDAFARALAMVLLAGYAVAVVGQWLQGHGVALLPHKTHDLLVGTMLASAACAGAAAGRWLLAEPRPRGGRGPRVALAVAAALAVAVPGTWALVDTWVLGRPASLAHAMRYPDGSWPGGAPPARPASAFGTRPGEPSVAEVRRAWWRVSGRTAADEADTVLLTNRVDLLATTPVHPFVPWKSIYSHPRGRFEERVALLRLLEACPDPACAAALLRDNDLDRVDGVVLSRDGSDLLLTLGVDNFPEGWRKLELWLPMRLFDGPQFRREEVDGVVVAALVDR